MRVASNRDDVEPRGDWNRLRRLANGLKADLLFQTRRASRISRRLFTIHIRRDEELRDLS